MAGDPKAIHEALETRLKAGTIDNTYDVFAFPMPSKAGPKIEVIPGAGGEPWINYWDTFGPDGIAIMHVTIRATLEGLADEDVALRAWRLASTGLSQAAAAQALSIPDAIHADKTLGGTVQTIIVGEVTWNEDTAVLEWPARIVLKKNTATV